jgi:RHH-type proline utilization regulon transcriptional repressor/proline dehydrogenase/delta 1-pyrroline-5-carboxylate dehydrogenase
LTGTFVPPTVIALERARDLTEEVFGPVLHVVRWRAAEFDGLLDDIAANGYGLTLGIHSRIDETAARIVARLANGNVYVNRNMIGAVVGTQPFGGTGLSGTGPKAGGPNYLRRFATEQVVTVNTAAAGGNASLLAESE